jgi:glycosyltransferase involved in cell wall biosynthesis
MNFPKMITLICSNFNSTKWIDGYLESVNDQTLPCFNIHFIDAGSTDGSWLKINNFKFRQGISVKYTIEKGCTVYEAWNIGYKEADSPYCMNYNTDDRLFPTALTVMLEHVKRDKDVDVLYSPCFVAHDDSHTRFAQFYPWPEFTKEALIKNCICGPFPLIKRDSAIDVGLFNPKFTISGDYEMWLRMEARGKKFKKVQEPIGSYYLNPKGVSTDPEKHAEHVKQDIKIRELYS